MPLIILALPSLASLLAAAAVDRFCDAGLMALKRSSALARSARARATGSGGEAAGEGGEYVGA